MPKFDKEMSALADQQIVIKTVQSRSQLLEWITFPITFLSAYPAYVPPLIKQELSYWNPSTNPALRNVKYVQFLAISSERIVGRIAGIIQEDTSPNGKKVLGRWGWIDFIDDVSVTTALLEATEKWAAGQSTPPSSLEGPRGITNLDKAGLLIEGFNELDNITTWYHPPYYRTRIEQCGYRPLRSYQEYVIKVPEQIPERLFLFNERVRLRLKLRTVENKTPETIISYARSLFSLLNKTHGNLEGYSPIEDELIDHYAERYARFIEPDFTSIILDESGELVAFGLALPNLSKAFKKANGKLWPLGWYHIRRAFKKSKRADLLLIGVHPDLQSKGVPALIFLEIMKGLINRGIKEVESNPELDSNQNVQRLWSKYDAHQHKSRMTFVKDIYRI